MDSFEGESFKKYIATIPSIYRPEFNRVINALLLAISLTQDEQLRQTSNSKDQLFVRTSTGQDLEKLANSLGVSKPATLGLSDEEFQELIPNLSLKPKQIKKAFYDTSDVFWGPLFSRANTASNNFAPFNLNVGDKLSFKVNNGSTQTIKILTGDIAIPGFATSIEVVTLLSKIKGMTTIILIDSITSDESINIRTNTPGSVGSIEAVISSGISTTKLDFTLQSFDILDLAQRVSIYHVNNNELIIELPAIVPSLRRTLRGSHHFHEDGTLETPKGTENGVWEGSFMFDPNGTKGNFTVSSQKATIQQSISKGDVLVSLTVDDSSGFESQTGRLIFGFGLENQEVPVIFRGVPNSSTILIDPSYVFTKDHPSGTVVNVIRSQKALVPQRDGKDLAIYLTSPSGAREKVQEILETLKAAGIIIRFVILAPDYKYLLDNPYISSDDAPSI